MKPATILHYPANGSANELQLELMTRDAPARAQVERFIHAVFAHAYDANVQHFLPTLLSLHNEQDKVLAALGMRSANEGPLFLENYFDTPIEQVLQQATGHGTTRECIIELGNLASVHRGGLRLLIIALTAYLQGAGAQWVVFTAVPIVLRAFAALKLKLYPLGAADKSRLIQGEDEWGSYYDARPIVVAGKVDEGFACLQAAIQAGTLLRFNDRLWEQAYRAGSHQRHACNRQQPAARILGAGCA